jgi:hypothetical protein
MGLPLWDKACPFRSINLSITLSGLRLTRAGGLTPLAQAAVGMGFRMEDGV